MTVVCVFMPKGRPSALRAQACFKGLSQEAGRSCAKPEGPACSFASTGLAAEEQPLASLPRSSPPQGTEQPTGEKPPFHGVLKSPDRVP